MKRIVGILFPDNTIPKKNIINKKGMKNLDINFERDLQQIGKIKKENIENL